MADQPAKKFRIGFVTATVWKNDTATNSHFYSVELSRTYKDGDENWQNSNGLGHSDLLNAAKLLERAEAWIAEQS